MADGILVVGGGIAGQAVCEAVRETDPGVPLTLVCGEPHLPYDRVQLSTLLVDGGEPDSLRLRPSDWYDDHDVTVLADGLAMAEELLSQPPLAELLIPEPPRARDHAAIRADVQHYYHPVGTAAMGLDPATSVCDPRGRVHGVDRIVVADVSLMPQIPRANTNIPAVMIGERIAQFLVP